ncbi:MAG: HD domain-containing protein [Bacteroidota bacterium]
MPHQPPPPRRPRVFRDPVHGDITFARGPFQRLLEAVIDTELFQRLRGIRQTAVMNLVFHGAEHSRFAHSMGAAHVAGLMVESAARNSGLEISAATREETVLAALLHDVGHGPFSHSLEEIIGPAFAHERMTVRILTAPESEIHALLVAHDPGLPERLRAYIEHAPPSLATTATAAATAPTGEGPRHWTHAIVSSQLDADRLDYLARDALMAGIRTHTFDLWRLVRSLVVIDNHLVVDARAQDIVEAFLLALDQMYGTAYYHKTVRAASLLLEATIRRALDLARDGAGTGAGARERLFPPQAGGPDPLYALLTEGDGVSLADFMRLDEAYVMSMFGLWREAPDPTLRELVSAHKTRRFPKMVRLPIETATLAAADWENAVATATAIFRARFPDRDPRYHVHFDEPQRLSYKRYAPGAGTEPIRVTGPDGTARPIESDPRSIANNLSTRLYVPRLFVPGEIRAEVERALGMRRPASS